MRARAFPRLRGPGAPATRSGGSSVPVPVLPDASAEAAASIPGKPVGSDVCNPLAPMADRDPAEDDTPDAGLMAAEALGEAGNSAGAVLTLHRLLGRFPDHPRAHYLLGLYLNGIGQRGEAIASCRTALRLAPKDPVAYRVAGAVLGPGLGVRREALEHLRKAVELAPDDGLSQYYLARHHAMTSHPRRARAGYARACALAPDDPMVLAGAAEYLFGLGRNREARRLAAAALAAGPDHHLALAAQARACLIEGRPAEAAALARASVCLNPRYEPAVAIAVESAMRRSPPFAVYFRLRNWGRRGRLHRAALFVGYITLLATALPNSGLPLAVWAVLDYALLWGAVIVWTIMGWLYRRRVRAALRPVSLGRRF